MNHEWILDVNLPVDQATFNVVTEEDWYEAYGQARRRANDLVRRLNHTTTNAQYVSSWPTLRHLIHARSVNHTARTEHAAAQIFANADEFTNVVLAIALALQSDLN